MTTTLFKRTKRKKDKKKEVMEKKFLLRKKLKRVRTWNSRKVKNNKMKVGEWKKKSNNNKKNKIKMLVMMKNNKSPLRCKSFNRWMNLMIWETLVEIIMEGIIVNLNKKEEIVMDLMIIKLFKNKIINKISLICLNLVSIFDFKLFYYFISY